MSSTAGLLNVRITFEKHKGFQNSIRHVCPVCWRVKSALQEHHFDWCKDTKQPVKQWLHHGEFAFRSGALSQRSAVANGSWVSIFFHKTTEIREPICTVHTARHAKPWGPCSHSQKWRGTCPSWIYGSGASAAWCIPHPIERGSIPRFPDRKMVQDTGTR